MPKECVIATASNLGNSNIQPIVLAETKLYFKEVSFLKFQASSLKQMVR